VGGIENFVSSGYSSMRFYLLHRNCSLTSWCNSMFNVPLLSSGWWLLGKLVTHVTVSWKNIATYLGSNFKWQSLKVIKEEELLISSCLKHFREIYIYKSHSKHHHEWSSYLAYLTALYWCNNLVDGIAWLFESERKWYVTRKITDTQADTCTGDFQIYSWKAN
jgi:uncharacterized membrane-anchored protein YitT (DUF2179 family)